MVGNKVEAILFDSGRVLNGPASGHWFISPKFFEYIDKNKFYSISQEKIGNTFYNAQEYINSEKLITTVEEELIRFKRFFEIFAEGLPELNLSNKDIEGLANDLVYNTEKYVFFDDAVDVIKDLNKSYKLAVVSDAWPSLIDVYKSADLYKYFTSFVISSIIGVTKPHEKMYMTALKELDVNAENSVFIDDNLNNCKGAANLGIKSLWLCRDKSEYEINKKLYINDNIQVINTLYDITSSKFFN